MNKKSKKAILYAFMVAVFYAAGVPFSKVMLSHMGPTLMAGLLYLGAGAWIGVMSLFRANEKERVKRLTRKDLPYVTGMIVLDIPRRFS